MRSCCEDQSHQGGGSVVVGNGDCLGFEAGSDEVNGSSCGSLEAELVEKDSKEVSLGREEGEGEFGGNRGVERKSRRFEVAAEADMPKMNLEVCSELLSEVQVAEEECTKISEAMEENGPPVLGQVYGESEGCESKVQPAFEIVDCSAGVNGMVDNGHHPIEGTSSHEKFVGALQEAEKEVQILSGVHGENMHQRLVQAVELQLAIPHADIANEVLAAVVRDTGVSLDWTGPADMSMGRKDGEEECLEYSRADKESDLLQLAPNSEVEATELLPVVPGDCFGCFTDENIGASKDVDTSSNNQKLEADAVENAESDEIGPGGTGSWRKQDGKECQGLVSEERKSGTEEEHDEFSLSPLRPFGGDNFGSMFGIEPEEGILLPRLLETDPVGKGSEDNELPVSPDLAGGCLSGKINSSACETADGHCCNQDYPQIFEATCTTESHKKLQTFEYEMANCRQHRESKFCMNGVNEEKKGFSLGHDQNLPTQYVRSWQEHWENDSNRPSHKSNLCLKGSGRRGVGCSEYGANQVMGPFSAAEGSASEEAPDLHEPHESDLSSLPVLQGSDFSAYIGMSACSNGVSSSCGGADNVGSSDSKSSTIIILRRSNPKRSASLRSNLAEGKFFDNLMSSRTNNRRKGRKSADISDNFLLDFVKISDKFKKKRNFHRSARASAWGPSENLARIFDQSAKCLNYDAAKIDIQNIRQKKGKSGISRKDPKCWKSGAFLGSSAKRFSTSDEAVFQMGVGLQTSDCQINVDTLSKGEAGSELALDKFAVAKKQREGEGQLVEKDMESSLTQEASAELGDCAGISSQIDPETLVEAVSDRNSLGPSTSPDSDVCHPVPDVGLTASEVSNSADQVIGIVDPVTSEDASLLSQTDTKSPSVPVPAVASEDGLCSAVFVSSEALHPLAAPLLHQSMCPEAKDEMMNGKSRGNPSSSRHFSLIESMNGPDNLNKSVKPSKHSKYRQTKEGATDKKNQTCLTFTRKAASKRSNCKSSALESSVAESFASVCPEVAMQVNHLENWILAGGDVSNLSSKPQLQMNISKGSKRSNGTKPQVSKGGSDCQEKGGRRRRNRCQNTDEGLKNSDVRCSFQESQTIDASKQVSACISFGSGAHLTSTMLSKQNSVPEDILSSMMTHVGDQLTPIESNSSLEPPGPAQVAWVLCDDCEKWRCILVELANFLEQSKCKWTCKDNDDKAFADCSIPQEKTNAEINAELGISDEEDPSCVKASVDAVEASKIADVAASERASWVPIKSNVFLHRNRRNQTIDEIMVCHCKPPQDGHWGCGDQCLNRMLNIECVKGTCPCGDLCSNQRFQKRKYAKFKWLRCGKKGYGLQLKENVSRGRFLIEYVGEVLDLATYEARQRYYASRGQKHFYFMTLNGGEVIDACVKGNLGRFINHSCEPNCRTEKWMVNGEVCIGLFAVRDIKKGEEVTFDYNYVRVVGAAAKKCVCGSSECRGYIGGDPLNSEIIVQGDSEDEDIEPVMIRGIGQKSEVKVAKDNKIREERKEFVVTCPTTTTEPEICLKDKNNICMPNISDISLQGLDSVQPDKVTSSTPGRRPLGASVQHLNSCQVLETVQPHEVSLQASANPVQPDSVLNSNSSVFNLPEENPDAARPHSLTKSSHPKGTSKSGRSSMKKLISYKTKTPTPGANGSHFDGVEEKLNVLLDINGGISKQKDATRGYLKLLFVTAAEGDVGGCASQSSRDLSLILDAILKTKSRKVLVDIINKNGLQMLHNIMKQNRGNFSRIPILRKLLKVLEFLAITRILTPELINKDPPCSGMESFKESILKLANHSDKQVHKIAREFRDKWIPRNIRRVELSNRDGGQLDWRPTDRSWVQGSRLKFQQVHAKRETDAIVISTADDIPASSSELDILEEASLYNQHKSISGPVAIDNTADGIKSRKRKSRWDCPSDFICADRQSLCSAEDQLLQAGPKFVKFYAEQAVHSKISQWTYGNEIEGNSSSGEVASSHDLMQFDDERPPGFRDDDQPPGFLDDEGPPGFRPFQNTYHDQLSLETAAVTDEVFVGYPQDIYLSQMPLSYGIPVALMQQLGTPKSGNSQYDQGWTVAPGMPFYPFPPLPSYPRGQPHPRKERLEFDQASGADFTHPSTSDGGMGGKAETRCRSSQLSGRFWWPEQKCERRFIRPERWNNWKFQRCPPNWSHQRFGRGFRRYARDGPSNFVGNMRTNFGRGSYSPEGVNNNDVGSNFHQQHN